MVRRADALTWPPRLRQDLPARAAPTGAATPRAAVHGWNDRSAGSRITHCPVDFLYQPVRFVTYAGGMRSYGQYCSVARALDVAGDRWTLLIVRELLLQGPCRFTDLKNGLPGIA